jgi:hypothetical protein
MTAAGSPAAHAQVLPPAALGLGLPSSTVAADSPCGTTVGQDVGGSAGSPQYAVCQGAGLTFLGPSVGQVAAIIGPTTIGPAFIGQLVVSGGAAVVSPVG